MRLDGVVDLHDPAVFTGCHAGMPADEAGEVALVRESERLGKPAHASVAIGLRQLLAGDFSPEHIDEYIRRHSCTAPETQEELRPGEMRRSGDLGDVQRLADVLVDIGDGFMDACILQVPSIWKYQLAVVTPCGKILADGHHEIEQV